MICVLLLLGAEGLLEHGEQLYRKHQTAEARAIFQRLTKREPSSARGRLWLGYSELALGNFEAAIRTLEPLEKTFGRDDEFLFSLSSNRIADLGDQSARAHQLLAYRYRAEGDVRNAESEFRKALLMRRDIPGLNLDLGNLLWEQQRHDEAAEALAAELQIQPHDFITNVRYGQYLLLRRQSEKARVRLEIAPGTGYFPKLFSCSPSLTRRAET
jgi:Tfp pilus assembly protein PilF